MDHLGPALTHYRHRAGLTLEQVGTRLDVNRSTLSRFETGQRVPGLSMLADLSAMYRVPLAVLVDPDHAALAAA